MLDNQCSELIPSSTGIPEGDLISVVRMIAIGFGWVQAVSINEAPGTRLGAFADNWGWSTFNHRDHNVIVEIIVRYTKCFDMTIDWAKSWLWGDSRQLVSLKKAIRPYVSDELTGMFTAN